MTKFSLTELEDYLGCAQPGEVFEMMTQESIAVRDLLERYGILHFLRLGMGDILGDPPNAGRTLLLIFTKAFSMGWEAASRVHERPPTVM